MGAGMGLVFGALFAAVLNGVDPKHAGSASGTLNAVQQVGGVIGVAVIGVIFFGQLSSNAPGSFNTIEPALASNLTSLHLPTSSETAIVNGAKQCFVDRSREKDSSVTPSSCKFAPIKTSTAKLITADITTGIEQANSRNFSQAFKWAISCTIGLLILTIGVTFLLPARFKTESYGEL
jgi:hypothetical protein